MVSTFDCGTQRQEFAYKSLLKTIRFFVVTKPLVISYKVREKIFNVDNHETCIDQL